jgi:glyceraldehyde-3-phosphate dehydrogenase (NADP+)
MADEITKRVADVFPLREKVPADADFAPGFGRYEKGIQYLVDGQVRSWERKTAQALSAICLKDAAGAVAQRPLGPEARLDRQAALGALDAARRAWDHGRGRWPTMRVGDRVEALNAFAVRMRGVREETVRLLMWEIGKSRADSEKEFDRTVSYIVDTIEALKEVDRSGARFSANDGVLAHIRRAPLGVVLCMGPFNYPLNETFTTLIPALAMGNTVVVKLPRFGALCQAPLLACFAECFPAGVVNIINGEGRDVAGPIVETGEIAALAFIGSSHVANGLKRLHPMPNRLRCVLGLDAKNPAIVLEDADLDLAVAECVTGSLSFNGQRCTALKLLFVHRAVAERFVGMLAAAVDALPFGMPWDTGVRITPLPSLDRVAKMQTLVADAQGKGARIANRHGGLANATFYFPSVVYPVTPAMELYSAEQFGPVVPVAVFDDVQEVFAAVVASNYGQQASIFGSDPARIGPLIDALANQVCRVNLNAQCQRGPDVYPFAGRKDSAEGTLSVSDALRCFSIRSMVAAPGTPSNTGLLRDIVRERTSNFVNTDYLF